MSSADTLNAAQRAITAGRAAEARQLLQAYARENPNDYRPWLWLAGLTASPGQSLRYLERAERLNPNDPAIARARAWTLSRMPGARGSNGKQPKPAAKPAPAPTATQVSPPAPPAQAIPFQAPPPRSSVSTSTADAGLPQRAPLREKRARTRREPWESRRIAYERNESQAQPVGRSIWLLAGVTFVVLALMLSSAAFVLRGQNNPVLASGEGQTRESTLPGVKIVADVSTAEAAQPITLNTVTPTPANTPEATPTLQPTPTTPPTATPAPTVIINPGVDDPLQYVTVGENERWIDVDLSTQTLTAYEGAVPVFQTLISSGMANHPTVTGQFHIWLRYESQTMDGRLLGYDYYLENVPYVMYFYRDYALHGTYWHNNFGTPMSHGCVNLATPDAEWLFNWSTIGTLVNVRP